MDPGSELGRLASRRGPQRRQVVLRLGDELPDAGQHLGRGIFARAIDENDSVGAVDRGEFKLGLFKASEGDADGDGRFNSTDLIRIMEAGKFETGEPAEWTEGDWNNDGVFDTTDLIEALKTGSFESTPARSIAIDEVFKE